MAIPTAVSTINMPERGAAELSPVYGIINNMEPGEVKQWTFTDDDCIGDQDPTTAARSFAGKLRMKYPRKKYSGFCKVAQSENVVYVKRLDDGIVDVT